MNILIDDIDEVVKNRISVDFRTDFRISIMFELLMQDNKIDKQLKVMQALNLYYPHCKDIKDYGKAIDDILWFYRCGREMKTGQNKGKESKQIYSYEFDDELIYDAFKTQYNINLQQIEFLHWWEFKAMFKGLNKNNLLIDIMGYRSMDISKIKDKNERNRYRKLQKQFALPDMRTEEQKEVDFANAFWNG